MNKRLGMFIHLGLVTLRSTEIGWSGAKQVPIDKYNNLKNLILFYLMQTPG